MKSTVIAVRSEAVICLSNLFTTLEHEHLWPLVHDEIKYVDLLRDYFKNIHLTSRKQVVGAIMNTIEFLCGLDE